MERRLSAIFAADVADAAGAEGFARAYGSEELVVYSPTRKRREAFAVEHGGRAADEPHHAVAGATVVLAAARSRGELPILFGDWLASRGVVVSIGSTVPEQREIEGTFDSPEYVMDAATLGIPKGWIIIGHNTSEESGMQEFADWLRPIVPEVKVKHVRAGNVYWVPR